MRVLLIPGYGGNPYLSELATALRATGADVEGVGGLGPAGFRERLRLFTAHDVIHVHWTHGYIESRARRNRALKALSFLTALLAARLRGCRIVWTIHNVFAHQGGDVPIERWFGRALMRIAHGAIVHCDAARGEVAGAYGLSSRTTRKIEVIPHAHYVDSYERKIGRDEARAALGLSPDATVFLHLGQVRPYKGLDHLLDAFAALDRSTAVLLVVGRAKSGSYARRIESRARQIEGVITTFEYVPDDSIQTYMMAADAVVLPYERILTSGTAILAMSFGRAVITPDIGCAGETLSHQRELLYRDDDPRGLVDALRLAPQLDLEGIGQRNLNAVRPIGWDLVATRTAAVYRGSA